MRPAEWEQIPRLTPEDVWAEVKRPDLRQIVEQRLRNGHLQLVRLDAPEKLALFCSQSTAKFSKKEKVPV
jgi:hypothetical protein